MKYDFEVREISKSEALSMVCKYHYSNTLPKINKHFLGFFVGGVLQGLITLGYGTRPLHTIKRLFPSLTTEDYYEIGRMCMTEEMPRNSESQMISACVKWIKENEPQIKVLFTWADGMLGKCGYVYQASGFSYVGYSVGEMYMKDGVKIHVRSMKQFLSPNDTRITVRPTLQQMNELGISHYKGKQYAYLKFLCGKAEKRHLIKECQVSLDQPFPKDKDLSWTRKDEHGKWVTSEKPPYREDVNSETKDRFLDAQMRLF